VAENWRMGVVPDAGANVRIIDGVSAVTFSGGSYEVGILSVAPGNALAVAGGSLSVTDASTVDKLSVCGGNFSVAEGIGVTIGELAFSAGSLRLDGTATLNRFFAWNPEADSAVSGAGSGRLNLAGTALFSGLGAKTLDGVAITNTGDVVYTAGLLTLGGSRGAVFNNLGTMDIQADLEITDSGGGHLINAGAMRKSAGAGDARVATPLTNSGLVRIDSGRLTLAGGSASSGQYVITPGAGLRLSGAAPHEIAGAGEAAEVVTGGGNLQISAEAGLWLSGDGTLSAAVANAGMLTGTGGGVSRFNGAVTNSGIVSASGGTMAFSGGYTQTDGLLGLTGGNISGDLRLLGGMLTGGGTVFGNLENLGGTVSPGASPGVLTVGGNYTQGADGILMMDIGGFLPGSGFDLLAVAGAATLDGTLNISQYGGFISNLGDAFELLTSDRLMGDFSALTADPGFAYSGIPGPSSYTVVNTLSPIFTALSNGYLINELLNLEAQNRRSLAEVSLPLEGAATDSQEIRDDDTFRKSRLICR
jgi:fibronectin-binding autotransporter adhesin